MQTCLYPLLMLQASPSKRAQVLAAEGTRKVAGRTREREEENDVRCKRVKKAAQADAKPDSKAATKPAAKRTR